MSISKNAEDMDEMLTLCTKEEYKQNYFLSLILKLIKVKERERERQKEKNQEKDYKVLK